MTSGYQAQRIRLSASDCHLNHVFFNSGLCIPRHHTLAQPGRRLARNPLPHGSGPYGLDQPYLLRHSSDERGIAMPYGLAVTRIIWPAIIIATLHTELAALHARCARATTPLLHLGIVRAAQRAQVIEPVLRCWMLHRRTRLDVISNTPIHPTAWNGARIAITLEAGFTQIAPERREVKRVCRRHLWLISETTRGLKDRLLGLLTGDVSAFHVPNCRETYTQTSLLSTTSLRTGSQIQRRMVARADPSQPS